MSATESVIGIKFSSEVIQRWNLEELVELYITVTLI